MTFETVKVVFAAITLINTILSKALCTTSREEEKMFVDNHIQRSQQELLNAFLRMSCQELLTPLAKIDCQGICTKCVWRSRKANVESQI